MIADGLHLAQRVIPASARYLEDLLTGPWPEERFLTVLQIQGLVAHVGDARIVLSRRILVVIRADAFDIRTEF